MERFQNFILKQQEEINNRMTEMFRLLKELMTSRDFEKNDEDNATTDDSIENLDGSDAKMSLKEAKKENEAENGTKNKPIKSDEKERTQAEEEDAVEVPSSQPVRKLTDERPAETDIRLSLAVHVYIYPLEVAEDVLVDVVGTSFLTTTKAVIKFDKGTVTLRSGKSKMSFYMIPESLCKIERGIKIDIEPIALTMTVNKLVLKWEERKKLHQEKEMKFDQWRSKTFKNKHPTLVKVENEVNDKGEVM
nr:hypothetical protein [Tanacetum cinerariifolium]